MKKHLVFILTLILLGLFAMKTFWGPHFYDGHDAQAHIVRLYQYDQALKDGQLPPRWAGGLMAGYGYPVFIFAYPLPYIMAELFHLSGFNLAVSLKLVFVLSYLASTMAMYFFASQYWQSRKAGFLSALLWSWAPYIFVKIFITASLGVVVSYAFIPLFFLSLYKLIKNPKFSYSIYLALTTSAWLLSHSFTPIIFSPLIGLFLLFNFQSKKRKQVIKYLSLSILFTFGLTAWYLVPALTELKYTRFADFITHGYANYFVTLKRLLYSKWGTGAPGWSNNPLSQQVGIAQWLAVLLALFLTSSKHTRKQLTTKVWPFLISFFLSIYLMLKISKPAWDTIPLLDTVHIPWRFLTLSVFSAALCAGFLVKRLKKQWLQIIVFGLLISLAIYGNRNHLRINGVKKYSQSFFNSYTGVATGSNEHLPIWIKDVPHEFPNNKVETTSGDCRITNLVNKSNTTKFEAQCSKESKILINTAYYPGWHVIINNSDNTHQVISNLEHNNGVIEISLNPGDHHIEAIFRNEGYRQLSILISIASLLLLLYLKLKIV